MTTQHVAVRVLKCAALALVAAACAKAPMLDGGVRKRALGDTLQREFGASIDAEKSAVIATTDEESEAFAAQSRHASTEVNKARVELRALLQAQGSPEELARLDVFDARWAQLEAMDARILPLAVANTNLKAAHLSVTAGAKAVDTLVDELGKAAAGSRDPKVLVAAGAASVGALRILCIHAPHIAASQDEVMTTYEVRTRALESQVEDSLKVLKGALPAAAQPHLSAAETAWAEARRVTAQVFKWSRENTNVISFELSTHDKRELTEPCRAALAELVSLIQTRPPQPSR